MRPLEQLHYPQVRDQMRLLHTMPTDAQCVAAAAPFIVPASPTQDENNWNGPIIERIQGFRRDTTDLRKRTLPAHLHPPPASIAADRRSFGRVLTRSIDRM